MVCNQHAFPGGCGFLGMGGVRMLIRHHPAFPPSGAGFWKWGNDLVADMEASEAEVVVGINHNTLGTLI